MEEARNETNDSLRKLSKIESEVQQTKQQYRQQEEELQRKSSKFAKNNFFHVLLSNLRES